MSPPFSLIFFQMPSEPHLKQVMRGVTINFTNLAVLFFHYFVLVRIRDDQGEEEFKPLCEKRSIHEGVSRADNKIEEGSVISLFQ